MSQFYDELPDLLTAVGRDIVADRFITCGDINCPGNAEGVNSDLLSVLDLHAVSQYVQSATR